ncbi:MAG: hypothetical protein IPH30_10635 [Betaproteobacteria bacterium]|nr:hypothetical protein [Betaproteobacteria bacterium]
MPAIWKSTIVPSGWRRKACVPPGSTALPTTWPALLMPWAMVRKEPGMVMSVNVAVTGL